MHWEALIDRPSARVRRHGRFLVADLRTPHRVLSTSVKNGGQTEHVRHLVNHQSCEGAGHDARFRAITEQGQEAYHDVVCAEIGLPAANCAVMGTAANMNYAAIATERDGDLEVTAIVTAGVQTNAVCAGDPAAWRETREGMVRVTMPAEGAGEASGDRATESAATSAASSAPNSAAALRAGIAADASADRAADRAPDRASEHTDAAPAKVPADAPVVGGTINTILLINVPITTATLARVVVTMTEGKSAALQRLAVPSCYSQDLATGTGTDQFCIAAPIDASRPPLTSASPHMKLGELVGLATRTATLEALRWQNGLEPSYTRGLFHALGRYGLKESAIFDELTDLLDPGDLELLRRNNKAAFYEPMVGAAAHALAAVLDRVRHGTLPPSVMPDAVLQQAAMLAASLAAQPHRWAEFRARLHDAERPGHAPFDPKALVLAAIALGWSEKWRQS